MKFFCDVPGLEENWVEISDSWRRSEAERLQSPDLYADFDQYWAFFTSKVKACHIVDADGNIADTVDQITPEFYANVDQRLAGFLGGVLSHASRELMRLGNRAARLSGTD